MNVHDNCQTREDALKQALRNSDAESSGKEVSAVDGMLHTSMQRIDAIDGNCTMEIDFENIKKGVMAVRRFKENVKR